MMLQVCQAWADQKGFVLSVEKSKATVLAGIDPLELAALTMYNEQPEWVKTFQYLGFTVYGQQQAIQASPARFDLRLPSGGPHGLRSVP